MTERIKTAIVTGASRGIGRALALSLAGNGHNVVIVARDEQKLRELEDEIVSQYDVSVSLLPVDLSNVQVTQDVLKKAIASLCSVDILVNCAGIFLRGTLGLTTEEFDRLYSTNVRSAFVVTQLVAPKMQEQGSGYIFNIVSRSGKVGFKNAGGYSMSKFALLGLGESLYRELAANNVKVTNICPSYVNTELGRSASSSVAAEQMISAEDICVLVKDLLNLSKNSYIREIIIECQQTIL